MRLIKVCFVVLALSAVVVASSHANVFVQWSSPGPYMWSGTGAPLLGPIGSGKSTVAQLLWSPDAVADNAFADTVGFLDPSASGNDVLLTSFTITEGSYVLSEYAWFDAPIYNDGGSRPDNGFIYARIFESSAVSVGDWYYVGPVVAASDLNPGGDPPDTAQSYITSRNANYNEIDGEFSRQVVPEPASISLLVLGAAVLGLRRRRR